LLLLLFLLLVVVFDLGVELAVILSGFIAKDPLLCNVGAGEGASCPLCYP
jgi:hypothetical protein